MKLTLNIIFLGILLLFSCSKSKETTETPAAQSVKGTWYGGAGSSNYELKFTDTSYTFGNSGFTLESGLYTVTGSMLNFNMKSSSLCSTSTSSFKHTYSVTGSSLKMTKVTDNCVFRSGVFEGNFTKK
jgi:hypothetical protein